MAEIVLVLGNGFDLDLGLKSRYIDFAESEEWYKLFSFKHDIRWEGKSNQSLLSQIQNAKYERWLDLEEEINTFVKQHLSPSEDVKNKNKEDFHYLKKALIDYLNRISNDYKTNAERLSFNLINTFLSNNNCHKNISSFNYTDCLKLCKLENAIYNKNLDYINIHGSLSEDIVLGCEVYRGNEINKDYSFFYKYNMLKKPNYIVRNLLEANEVIFFGHSINEMDFCYFRDYFKAMSTPAGKDKNLTIICKDDKSAIDIRDNIRSQGIIVTDLYNNLHNIDFLHTDLIYNNGEDAVRWNGFLNRLKEYNKKPSGVNYRN